MSAFDPNSNDAMFAKVLAKLDEHGTTLERIESRNTAAYELLSGRVASIESWRDNIRGRVAVAAAGFSALVAGAVEIGKSLLHSKQ